MNNELYNDFNKRIRHVFDNFEDTNADAGWALLREKYPPKESRRAIGWLWWSSVAALALLFLGVWLLKENPAHKKKLVVRNSHPTHLLPQTERPGKGTNQNGDTEVDGINKNHIAKDGAQAISPEPTAIDRKNNQAVAAITSNDKYVANSSHHDRHTTEKLTIIQPTVQSHQAVAMKKYDNASPGLKNRLEEKLANSNVVANEPVADKANTGSKTDSAGKKSVEAIAVSVAPVGIDMQKEVSKSNKQVFAENEAPTKKSEKLKSTEKAVRFGVYAATYFNYAKGSANQLNVGAGLTSEIKLSKNLDLSTGLSIGQNTLSYAGQTATPQVNTSTAPVKSTFLVIAGQSAIIPAATATLKNYNANLVGLDVPINLKFELNPEKSNTYVLLGLSSGTFINETYTYSYNNTTPFAANINTNSNQSTHQNFNSFYFAKTLNFSFGTGYTVGHNKLMIEPFVKYPLDGMGSQQIKFGSGGLNLKFNLRAKK